MRTKAPRLTALATGAIALAASIGNPTLAVAAPPAAGTAPAASTTAAGHAVTLVTGDRVRVTDRADGTRQVAVEAGPGRAGIPYAHRTIGNQLTIVPADAQPLLARGQLDPRLFDIDRLITLGYDDRSRADLPLIVRYGAGRRPAAVAGATVRRHLASVGGAALRAPKATATSFWKSADDFANVWLDGRSQLLDDASNAQIGVPTAWQAGYTGRGVTVAVLDGGYDASHPDLTNVAEAKDFTGSPNGPADEYGHGTHVASIVAGSGTASGGKYRGVAPDARLLVGRVCGLEYCEDSAILAGMEWAAAQRAKVVNLSLGSAGSDGTDPLSVAINNLTASAGTLFVAAAGNSGANGKVGAPAAADAALAVGSVNGTDGLSTFSSRGPRLGDFAIKPDLTAPGEKIVAARAAGTDIGTPVGEHYTTLSGTSMATPHVAGAAAILAQQHPDWTPAQLKAGLLSTAKPAAGHSVFEQGAGRLDVARLVTQPVHAEPGSLSYGLLKWPRAGLPPTTRTITYRNSGDTPVTLNLSLTTTGPDNTPVPDGAFTLSATSLIVPPHGTAEARVTQASVALETAPTGTYAGRLVATSADGVTVAQTPISVTTEPESYDVSVTQIDRAGAVPDDELGQFLTFFQLDFRNGGVQAPEVQPADGRATVRLRKGTYAVHSAILTANPANPGIQYASASVETVPRLVVDKNISLTFDARRSKKIDALVDAHNPTHLRNSVVTQYTAVRDSGDVNTSMGIQAGGTNDLYATPVTSDPRSLVFGYETILSAPQRLYFVAIPVPGRIPADPRFRLRDRDLARVDARYHTLGVKAAIADRVEFGRYMPGQNGSFGEIIATPMPSRRTEYFTTSGSWSPRILQQYLPEGPRKLFEGQVDGPRTVYKAGTSRVQHWNDGIAGADLLTPDAPNLIVREEDSIGAQFSVFSPGENGHVDNPVGGLFLTKGTTTLHRDGVLVGTKPFAGLGSFSGQPAEKARYTLTVDATRPASWTTLASKVTSAWTFDSVAEPTFVRLPLPSVKVTGDFDGQGAACAGAPFTLVITAGTQADAEPSTVDKVVLEVSADDGATWTPVRVRGGASGVWRARLVNPETGHVSIRVKASDVAGSTVEQTVIRAYAVTH